MVAIEKNSNTTPPLWRGLLPLIVFSILATQDGVVTLFGSLCKPIILATLNLLQLETLDQGLTILVEHLEIPWTRDCAGINLLLVLLAVFAWMNRRSPQDKSYWLRMLAMIPAAIAANVLRVLSLVVYRFTLYPEIESPQLHYFLGFLWLIPFALLAIPRDTKRPKKALWFELLHISSVMGLLAPLLSLSSHWITAFGALFCLINSHYTGEVHRQSVARLAIWCGVAAAIAWTGVESLWLPWLIACPLTINPKWLMKPQGIACLATACPLFTLLPGANLIATGVFAYSAIQWYRAKDFIGAPPLLRLSRFGERFVTAALAPMLLCPFLASTLLTSTAQSLKPPDTAEQRIIKGLGYELRLADQPTELGLLWYDPQSNDRHHAVEVCLQYRGIHLSDSEVPAVKTDGSFWYKEFFLVNNELIDDHKAYLWHTLGFQRDPGIHIILIAEQMNYTANTFAEQATLTAEQLHKSLQ